MKSLLDLLTNNKSWNVIFLICSLCLMMTFYKTGYTKGFILGQNQEYNISNLQYVLSASLAQKKYYILVNLI